MRREGPSTSRPRPAAPQPPQDATVEAWASRQADVDRVASRLRRIHYNSFAPDPGDRRCDCAACTDGIAPDELAAHILAAIGPIIERERRAAQAEALREAAQKARDSVDDGGVGACWPSELDKWADEIERDA